MAHNGNLTNYQSLAEEITQKDSRYLNTTSDSEVLLHYFADLLHTNNPPEDSEEFFYLLCNAVTKIFKRVKGAYSVTSLVIGKGLVVFRDPHGIRPLVKGERSDGNGGKDYIFASENTMFYALGFEPKGTVLPGELIYVDESGKVFSKRLMKKEFNPQYEIMKTKILVTGGTGRFGTILKKLKTNYEIFYPNKKTLDITDFRNIQKYIENT